MTALLPTRILELMSPVDKKALGRAGWTADESLAKSEARSERAEQRTFRSWLSLNDIAFISARPDKKSTIGIGLPDFCVLFPNQPAIFIEMKVTAKLSDDQRRVIAWLEEKGFKVTIARSAAQAISYVKSFIQQHN
jgi:hypothetical protein